MLWCSSSLCTVPWQASSDLSRLCPKHLVRHMYPNAQDAIFFFLMQSEEEILMAMDEEREVAKGNEEEQEEVHTSSDDDDKTLKFGLLQ